MEEFPQKSQILPEFKKIKRRIPDFRAIIRQKEAKRHNQNLPGMGGVFNTVNASLYHYAGNNPVKYSDPDGNFPIAVVGAVAVWGFNAGLLGYGLGVSRNDEVRFAFKHPVIVVQIGRTKLNCGCTNISTNSTRFTAAVGNDDYSEGGQVNAIRHALWSSVISSKFGTTIAKEATDSHETNPNITGFAFSEIIDADSRCDLLNNEIGISLGDRNKNSNMKNLTKKVLDIYHNEGLWMSSKNEDGNWIVSRQKMSDADYLKAIEEWEKCNENGFRPGEQ